MLKEHEKIHTKRRADCLDLSSWRGRCTMRPLDGTQRRRYSDTQAGSIILKILGTIAVRQLSRDLWSKDHIDGRETSI